jgi:hypothetical protein
VVTWVKDKEEINMTKHIVSLILFGLTFVLTAPMAPHVILAQVVTSDKAGPLILPVPPNKAGPSTLPVVPDKAGQLILTFATGGDDLRGGNDNLDVFLVLRDGKMLRFDNVNQSRRWGNNSLQVVTLPLPPSLTFDDLVALRLETHATGGIAGDNWNLDHLIVQLRFGRDSDWQTVFDKKGDKKGEPLFRFTGNQRVREFRWEEDLQRACGPPRANVCALSMVGDANTEKLRCKVPDEGKINSQI